MLQKVQACIASDSVGLFCLIIAFIFFISFRLFVVHSITDNRELPIEVDDSLVYALAAKNLTEDPLRKNITSTSAATNSSLGLNEETRQRYFAHAWSSSTGDHVAYGALLKLMALLLGIEALFAITIYSFLLQPLQLASFYLFSKLTLGLNNFGIGISTFFFSFAILGNPHMLTATPFSFAVCLTLLGMAALETKKFLLALFLFITSIYFHLGAVTGIGMYLLALTLQGLLNARIEQTTKKQTSLHYLNKLSHLCRHPNVWIPLSACGIAVILNHFLVEILGYSPLMIGTALEPTQVQSSLINTVAYNLKRSIDSIFNSLAAHGIPTGLLVFLILANIIKNTRNITNMLLLAWATVWLASLFHIIPYHPGGLTKYILQYLSIFVCGTLGFVFIGEVNGDKFRN